MQTLFENELYPINESICHTSDIIEKKEIVDRIQPITRDQPIPKMSTAYPITNQSDSVLTNYYQKRHDATVSPRDSKRPPLAPDDKNLTSASNQCLQLACLSAFKARNWKAFIHYAKVIISMRTWGIDKRSKMYQYYAGNENRVRGMTSLWVSGILGTEFLTWIRYWRIIIMSISSLSYLIYLRGNSKKHIIAQKILLNYSALIWQPLPSHFEKMN